jgi:glucose/mannose transport system substrate-binding protein
MTEPRLDDADDADDAANDDPETGVTRDPSGAEVNFRCGDSAALEILSWWTSDHERDALEGLLDIYADACPNVDVFNSAGTDANVRLDERMAAGNPPSTYQDNTGQHALEWAFANGVDASDSKLDSLNALAAHQTARWFDTMPAALLDMNSIAGNLYAVPVNVHRQNNVYYKVSVLEEEELEMPTSPEELKALGEALLDRGYEHPFCVGNRWSWTMDFYVFEGLLPALAGADYHRRYWAGQESPTSMAVTEALQFALDIWPLFNEDSGDLTWSEGVDKLLLEGADSCVVTMMGDWARRYLEEAGWEGEEDFYERPFPGSEGIFVVSGDSFTLPTGGPHRGATQALLRTFGSAEGQTAFNQLKGAIPARLDVNLDDFGPAVRRQLRDFRSDTIVGGFRSLIPPGALPDLGPVVKEMLGSGDIDVALEYLAQHYVELE